MSSPDHQLPATVLLMGAPIGIGNRGVSALGASAVRLIYGACPTARIALLIGNKDDATIRFPVDGQPREIRVVNHRWSPRARLSEQLGWIALLAFLYRCLPINCWRRRLAARNRWIRAVVGAELVADIRGGDSFSDIYGVRRFLLGNLAALSVIWIRGRIALLPQTYGPYQSWWARVVARYILLRTSVILSRDTTGLDVVRQLTQGRREAIFCPDVAFALEARLPGTLQVEPPLPSAVIAAHSSRLDPPPAAAAAPPADPHPPPSITLVGLNVSGLMYNGGYTRDNMFGLKLDYRAFLDQLLRAFLARPEIKILLVPHTFAAPGRVESDNEACALLAAAHPPEAAARVHLVAEAYDQFHIKGVIGLCDFFIGSRMHACIAALSQGIPAVGVAYSRKFVGVFDSVGAQAWVVDGREVTASQAVDRILELFDQRAALRPILAARVAEAQAQLRQQFARLFARGDG